MSTSTDVPSRDPYIIVIGASAGGVDAVRRLAAALPGDLPAAVLVTLHLSRSQPSNLAGILEASGPLPAAAARDGERILCGRIYVAPPNEHLLVFPGRVRLWQGPRENSVRPSINALFRSAARAYGPRVIGVLLSGRLHDGTAGLMMVKARGGIAVLQDPNETLYSEMPLSAMKHVAVDYVLPLAEIPPLLAQLVRTPPTAGRAAQGRARPQGDTGGPASMTPLDEHAMAAAISNGESSGFVCPECGGALWEAFEGGVIHYHCHVGHVFSADGLLNGQADAVERGLWTAVRALEDRAALSLRVARRLRGAGDDAAARRLESRARVIEERAALVRRTLEHVLRPELIEETEPSARPKDKTSRKSAGAG